MDINKFKEIFENTTTIGEKIYIENNLAETVKFVKENYHFDILKEIIAVDNQENGIELIYRLYSAENEEEALLATIVRDEVESVCNIFDSAYADEKEIYDLFGVRFVGNQELKRLYMPEDWKGHPLRKDYMENDERLNWND
ncbi:NADH-quinone oxidoreductase subunit C [bacterium]|nr:NADH-quinone oxidoreductase subunit C [bacterium]